MKLGNSLGVNSDASQVTAAELSEAVANCTQHCNFIYLLAYSLTHSLTHPLTHSLTHSLTHWCCSCVCSSIHRDPFPTTQLPCHPPQMCHLFVLALFHETEREMNLHRLEHRILWWFPLCTCSLSSPQEKKNIPTTPHDNSHKRNQPCACIQVSAAVSVVCDFLPNYAVRFIRSWVQLHQCQFQWCACTRWGYWVWMWSWLECGSDKLPG